MKNNHPVATAITLLSVNVNKVALLRNSRHLGIPSVTKAASILLEAGAAGITVHPRPDQRHIRDSDVHELSALMKDWPDREFNIEGNPLHNLIPLIEKYQPHQCTFVPDSENQLTSDHGWQLPQSAEQLLPLIQVAKAAGSRVSLFMDADATLMPLAQQVGADRVELYTEPYAAAFEAGNYHEVLEQFAKASAVAAQIGLGVNAGHDLNLFNLTPFLKACPQVQEVSIGHAFMADSLELGYAATTKAYLAAIQKAFV